MNTAPQRSSRVVPLFAFLWLGTAAFGLYALFQYSVVPGPTGALPESWPSGSRIVRHAGQSTLLMFVHPECPCSKANLNELARAIAGSNHKTTMYVVFYDPSKRPEVWGSKDLLEQAGRIPEINIISDRDNAEARLFGVKTSGHTLFYDPDGKLIFSGGVTASRGHEGDNAGREAIASLTSGGTTLQNRWPVFGCSLTDETGKTLQVNNAAK